MRVNAPSCLLNALALVRISSLLPTCSSQFVPLESLDDVSISLGSGNIVETKLHVVDPWIRPPRGVETQQGIGAPGDFDNYPRIAVTPFDRIKFIMRPIAREGGNTQRHGVYVITNKQLVQDYLDGKSEHPCGEPVYTEDNICQVVENQGLNGTDCPDRVTLFPLLEIFGSSGEIEYTASGLASLADSYGVETSSGSKILAFDCPWIQGRKDDGSGRTSHCIGGMFLTVEVLDEAEVVIQGDTSDGGKPFLLSAFATASIAMASFILFL